MSHTETLHIYIGYDSCESEAYHVLCHSILTRSSMPVAFHPVKRSLLESIYNRETNPKQSNEFSFTRFLVPYLNGYQGWALFIDLDQMFRTDIKELFDLRDPLKSVMCCQHDYEPSTDSKYLGNVQYQYPRKNWSSVMLFNCSHFDCRTLTPKYVNEAPALDLHRMLWTEDHSIGSLPLEWNFLVGEYIKEHMGEIKNVHWTIGGPWFNEYIDTDFADEWFKERFNMRFAQQLEK